MNIMNSAIDYIQQHSHETLELLKELSRIPAPSGREEKRVAFCMEWLHKNGVAQAYTDSANNVIIPFGDCGSGGPITAFLAHSDVVFPDTELLPQKVEGDRLYTPGVGDNTLHVVHLLMAARYIAKEGLSPAKGILLIINSGEEGLGNLYGCRRIIETFGDRIDEFYSLDCMCGTIYDRTVGSKRYRVEVKTEGGHSYSDFGNKNAIVYLASMISELDKVELPTGDKVTYNVGTISGGTSVNTIAQQAEMLYEFRSPSWELLERMDSNFNNVVEAYRAKGITVNVEVVGERPCAKGVDAEKQAQLAAKAAAAVQRYYDGEIRYTSASTDCNIPLSVGIPAVNIGTYLGAGPHTREEYVLISSIPTSQKIVFDIVLGYFCE